MKRVNKNFIDRPASLKSTRGPFQNAIQSVLSRPGWHPKASTLYRSHSVKEALIKIYNGKCAFCDNKPVGSPGQVEHFRPKDGIKGTTHTGYYWLAYEWSNLLLACGNCNTTKNNHFRIRDNLSRVNGPSFVNGNLDENANFIKNTPLSSEDYYLLNPELDDPTKHLTYSVSGEIHHLTDRGEESILRYDLNRDELYVNGRKAIREKILLKLLRCLERYDNGVKSARITKLDLIDVINDDILSPISKNGSFSSFYIHMLKNYNCFFNVGEPRSSILLSIAFNHVINSNLHVFY